MPEFLAREHEVVPIGRARLAQLGMGNRLASCFHGFQQRSLMAVEQSACFLARGVAERRSQSPYLLLKGLDIGFCCPKGFERFNGRFGEKLLFLPRHLIQSFFFGIAKGCERPKLSNVCFRVKRSNFISNRPRVGK